MKNKVINIISQVIGYPAADMDEESSPDTIDQWDSLGQMKVVVALEEEFDIKFLDEQIMNMWDVTSILAYIEKQKSS